MYNFIICDRRVSISCRNFAYTDILKRTVAKVNKLNYIEIFFKRRTLYTLESLRYILDEYTKNSVNVFIEPYKKFNCSNTYFYDLTRIETIKQLI